MRKVKSKTPKAHKTIKRPDLTIEVKNFGPISKGTVSLKNLTVLIGQNNSGKSYIAMLVHALAESYNQWFIPIKSPIDDYVRKATEFQNIANTVPELENFLRPLINSSIGNSKIPDEISISILDELYKYFYKHYLKATMEKMYACQHKELTLIDQNSYKIKITHNGNISVLCLAHHGESMKINNTINLDRIDNQLQDYFGRIKNHEITDIRAVKRFFVQDYNEIIAEQFKMPFSYCLPAGRTGILQCYRTLYGTIVNNLTFSSTRKTEPASMQGTVVELLYNIYEMPEKKGPLYDMAVEFEQDTINGEIVIERTLPGSFPRIQYRFKETVIPIHRTSSTVSELAPIILYLKYYIEPGDIMIIEEPEAHLHPSNQRLMAKLLVRLIRAGVYVIITTHSDFLLEQLSYYLLLSTLPEEKRQTFDKELYLSLEELGAYVFHQNKSANGYQIREAEIDKDNGISDEEFLKITESLFDDTMKIRDSLRD
ncbi:MAG: AAA family ATPase [Nitrospirae bacterium]|nr:AAA family ATPase [Nitrospirota bacterium]